MTARLSMTNTLKALDVMISSKLIDTVKSYIGTYYFTLVFQINGSADGSAYTFLLLPNVTILGGGIGISPTGLITATGISGPDEVIIIVGPSYTFTEFAHIAKVPVSCDSGTVAASGLGTIGSLISTQALAGREIVWLAFNRAIIFICGSTDSHAGLPFPNVPPVAELVRLLVRRPVPHGLLVVGRPLRVRIATVAVVVWLPMIILRVVVLVGRLVPVVSRLVATIVLVLADIVVILGGCLDGDREDEQGGGGNDEHLDLAEEGGGRREEDRGPTSDSQRRMDLR